MIDPRRWGFAVGRFWVLAVCVGALALAPRTAHAASTGQPFGLHYSSTVLKGPDAGIRLEGFLSLTPGTGTTVTGTLATFGGAIMSRLASYTPISVAGTVDTTQIALTFDLSSFVAKASSGDDQMSGMGAVQALAQPHFANLGAHPTLHVTGIAMAGGAFAGTLGGPSGADSGAWTAVPAVGHGFDFNAVSKVGKKLSLSGQASVVFGQDGSIVGLYVSDDYKGIYPVRGVIGNHQMSMVLSMGNGQLLYGSGQADHIDDYQFYSGTFFAPDGTTSGKWSAAFTS